MSLPPKICPSCRDEFLPTALVCAECDVALVLPDELEEAAQAQELPPASELVCIRTASVGWAMGLAERLGDAGIPCRIEQNVDDDDTQNKEDDAKLEESRRSQRAAGHAPPYGVFVLPKDVEDARALDAQFMQTQMPDLPEEFAEGAVGDADSCPACGDPLEASASECAGCGLFVGG